MKKKLSVLAVLLLLVGGAAVVCLTVKPQPTQTDSNRVGVTPGINLPITKTNPLPAMDFLLQHAIERAINKEDENDNLFDMNYRYTRVRITEFRNRRGELKSREEKRTQEDKPLRLATLAAKPAATHKKTPSPAAKDAPVSDTHSNFRGKALEVKDYSISNLVSRFQFTLVGRELLNGRSSLVVDFKPANKKLPVNNFKDKFINQGAGRIWVDEEDYAVAQGQLHLTEPVNVFGGLVGAVWKFTYGFTRVRTPEGYWFARQIDWHLEGREVIFNRIVDYHEQKLNEQKIVTTTAR